MKNVGQVSEACGAEEVLAQYYYLLLKIIMFKTWPHKISYTM